MVLRVKVNDNGFVMPTELYEQLHMHES